MQEQVFLTDQDHDTGEKEGGQESGCRDGRWPWDVISQGFRSLMETMAR